MLYMVGIHKYRVMYILLSYKYIKQIILNKAQSKNRQIGMSMLEVHYPNYLLPESIQAQYFSYIQSYPLLNQYIVPQVNTDMLNYSPKNNIVKSKVKTSLCKKWAETNSCPYGFKCQFAHGIEELRCNVDENSYKTKPCIAFFKKGYCQYGNRCNFSHTQNKQPLSEISQTKKQMRFIGYQQIIKEGLIGKQRGSRLVKFFQDNTQGLDEKSQASTIEYSSQIGSFNKQQFQKCSTQNYIEDNRTKFFSDSIFGSYDCGYQNNNFVSQKNQTYQQQEDGNTSSIKQIMFIDEL